MPEARTMIAITVLLLVVPSTAENSSPSTIFITCSSGGLPISCTDSRLAIGGTVCHTGSSWSVDLWACTSTRDECSRHTDTSPHTAARCSRRLSAEDAQRALLLALNELQIPLYSVQYTLGGAQERLGGYLRSFVMGFLGSMAGEEVAVRHGHGIGGAPDEVQEQLRRQLDEQTASTRSFNDALDDAVTEGLVIGALQEAKHVGWKPWLARHIKLRVMLTDLKINEGRVEFEMLPSVRATLSAAGAAIGTNYTPRELGYGSTYLTTVFRVLFSSEVQQRWRVAARNSSATQQRMVVFGSNLGWQCFFGALLFGVQADGYEIVQHRYDASVEFARKHGMETEVRFWFQDATVAEVEWGQVGLVYMTDLLWDPTVQFDVRQMVARQASPGTVLVANGGADYSGEGFVNSGVLRMISSAADEDMFRVSVVAQSAPDEL